jgi:hypothetical protein
MRCGSIRRRRRWFSLRYFYARPPTPQFWGTFEPILFQSPPELGDLGGGILRTASLTGSHPLVPRRSLGTKRKRDIKPNLCFLLMIPTSPII